MAANDRLVLVEADGTYGFCEREGRELHGRIVTREGLRAEFPRLYAELVRADNKDAPKVIAEPRR